MNIFKRFSHLRHRSPSLRAARGNRQHKMGTYHLYRHKGSSKRSYKPFYHAVRRER